MRHEGWEMLLGDYVTETANKLFSWGECDCLTFVCDWAVMCCGVDPMNKKKATDPETIRGAYSTKEEAYSLIKKLRKNNKGIMDLHFKRIDPFFAKRGDIVLSSNVFGLVMDGKAFFKKEELGMKIEKLHKGMTAWHLD